MVIISEQILALECLNSEVQELVGFHFFIMHGEVDTFSLSIALLKELKIYIQKSA